ncbi:MAG: type II toxin-antitoxin system PemK/MazF family toxin [Thermodesulfobacteriota bacterium]|nr:type II toxin-antitoxin system PemK/MazF family toxin [Thermodesulfobacteriota bacterium]
MGNYIPDRGDAVWINFNPQAGYEQSRRSPAVVLSRSSYNGKVGLAIFCPVTNQVKGYPFEAIIPSGLKIAGAILSDQFNSLDWKIRNAEFYDKIPESIIFEIFKKLSTLLRFDK